MGNDSAYALLDSGDGEKLERFGPLTIRRPSSLAIWRKRAPKLWQKADLEFRPGTGWNRALTQWQIQIDDVKIELRPQKNGQVGIFPDHLLYLDDLLKAAKQHTQPVRVLNLFAFTGMATVFLRKLGASVCHVDLAKHAIAWASHNLEINDLQATGGKHTRLISDDAIKFLSREVKRDNRYEIVLIDPPSFGRTGKNKSWKLEEVIYELLRDCLMVLSKRGALFFTCHHSAFESQVLANIARDIFSSSEWSIDARDLHIPELNSPRKLPAGHLVICRSENRAA